MKMPLPQHQKRDACDQVKNLIFFTTGEILLLISANLAKLAALASAWGMGLIAWVERSLGCMSDGERRVCVRNISDDLFVDFSFMEG